MINLQLDTSMKHIPVPLICLSTKSSIYFIFQCINRVIPCLHQKIYSYNILTETSSFPSNIFFAYPNSFYNTTNLFVSSYLIFLCSFYEDWNQGRIQSIKGSACQLLFTAVLPLTSRLYLCQFAADWFVFAADWSVFAADWSVFAADWSVFAADWFVSRFFDSWLYTFKNIPLPNRLL